MTVLSRKVNNRPHLIPCLAHSLCPENIQMDSGRTALLCSESQFISMRFDVTLHGREEMRDVLVTNNARREIFFDQSVRLMFKKCSSEHYFRFVTLVEHLSGVLKRLCRVWDVDWSGDVNSCERCGSSRDLNRLLTSERHPTSASMEVFGQAKKSVECVRLRSVCRLPHTKGHWMVSLRHFHTLLLSFVFLWWQNGVRWCFQTVSTIQAERTCWLHVWLFRTSCMNQGSHWAEKTEVAWRPRLWSDWTKSSVSNAQRNIQRSVRGSVHYSLSSPIGNSSVVDAVSAFAAAETNFCCQVYVSKRTNIRRNAFVLREKCSLSALSIQIISRRLWQNISSVCECWQPNRSFHRHIAASNKKCINRNSPEGSECWSLVLQKQTHASSKLGKHNWVLELDHRNLKFGSSFLTLIPRFVPMRCRSVRRVG